MNRTIPAAALLCAAIATARAAPPTPSEQFHTCRTANGAAAIAACTAHIDAASPAMTPAQRALVHMLRAQAYIDDHKLAEALADYDAATHAEPANADAWYSHAVVAGGLGKLDIAIAGFTRAIALRPGWTQAYVARAATYLAHGDPQKALDDDNKALLLDPNNKDAQTDRAAAQQRLGKRWQH